MSLPSSPFIVRADRVRAGLDAKAILAAADAEAQRIRAGIAAERQAALADARQEGLRQGLAEAAAMTAGAGDARAAVWRARAPALAAALAGAAGGGWGGRPGGGAARRGARGAPGAADRVSVIADPAAGAGECTLLHARGRTDIGLLAQFRSMLQGLPGDAGVAR